MYSSGKEGFNVMEGKQVRTSHQPNRRQRLIKEIRKEIRSLCKAYKKANEDEKIGLQELRDVLRQRLQSLRKAEQTNTRRKKKARTRAAFVANPYKFSIIKKTDMICNTSCALHVMGNG